MHRVLPLLLVPALASADTGAARSPFAARLDGEVAKSKGNLIYSPASVSTALAMAREGAKAETAAEMDAVLGADNSTLAKALLRSLHTADAKPGEPRPPELAIANRIFADSKTPFEQAFLDVTAKDYLAPAETVDFRGHHDDARLTINKWVAGQTHDRIRDLVPGSAITKDTRMVLVNAMYLKAQWETPFAKEATKPDDFAVIGDRSKRVATMHGIVHANWGTHAGARMIDLPYYSGQGPSLGMMIVVPDTKDLAAVEAAYGREGFAGFQADLKSYGTANVALPKFEVGTTFDLGGALEALGMNRAFSDRAEFGGISSEPTKISKVVHKAWASVDENGTEATAATAVVMVRETGVEIGAPHPFKVDRSFLFFIHDARGNVLFGGRIVDPSLR